MPNAAMHFDYFSLARDDDVRFARQFIHMKSIVITEPLTIFHIASSGGVSLALTRAITRLRFAFVNLPI